LKPNLSTIGQAADNMIGRYNEGPAINPYKGGSCGTYDSPIYALGNKQTVMTCHRTEAAPANFKLFIGHLSVQPRWA
jgi:hypothetical protein